MAESRNLAAKYAKQVDERFNRESQAMLALNSNYDFVGVKTVNIYSLPTVAMVDYTRNGANRYGTPDDLTRNIQTLTINRDRAFTFIIDKGDKLQSQMVMDAGRALNRQLKEVWVPEFDSYVFRKLAAVATEHGNYATTAITKSNAYEMFLAGMEHMGNKNVPDKGRVAFCSYKFANFLKLDPAFVKQGDDSQEMVAKGVIGEVDGCKIVRVPSSKLPAGCAFLITHKIAATAPKQLEEYKTHNNPPGISGWLVEGRVIYDCFVLNEKSDAIYYHGSQAVLRNIDVVAADLGGGNYKVLVNPEAEAGCSWYYKVGTAFETVAYDASVSNWTALAKSGATINAGENTHITVVEAGADGKAKAVGTYLL